MLQSGEEWLSNSASTRADKPSSGGDSRFFYIDAKWEEGTQAGERQKEIDKLIWQHKDRQNGRAHQMKTRYKEKYIFQRCMELCSFPIQFPIHNGLACLCAETQTQLFFMSIRDNCVQWLLSVALTWEILNLSSLQLHSRRPPMWLFLKQYPHHSLSWCHKTDSVFFFLLHCHTLACNVVIVFCRKESLKAGKNLRSYIFPNWKFCSHFVSPSLSFFHPLLHYFLYVILLDVCVDGLSDYLNSSSQSKAGHISFEEWQARSRKDQSNAKLKFKRKLKSM